MVRRHPNHLDYGIDDGPYVLGAGGKLSHLGCFTWLSCGVPARRVGNPPLILAIAPPTWMSLFPWEACLPT